MATDLPYMPSSGNVGAILDKIRGAGTPPKFTLDFLKKQLGFGASQDRSFPRVLKQLGFLSTDGVPQPRYNEYKNATTGGRALAQGLREGWPGIFLADQNAQNRTTGELKEVFKSVTGQGESVAAKMAATFKALAMKADWSAGQTGELLIEPDADGDDVTPAADGHGRSDSTTAGKGGVSLHHDIHVHLPPTSDVAVYRAIFRALREELV